MTHKFTDHDGYKMLTPKNLRSEYENRAILEEVEGLVDFGHNKFIINLGKLTFMNSAGFGFLIAVLTKARNAGGEVVILNISEHVSKLLIMMKLKNVFTIVESLEEAIQFFKNQSHAERETDLGNV